MIAHQVSPHELPSTDGTTGKRLGHFRVRGDVTTCSSMSKTSRSHAIIFCFLFGIHTASVPSTAGTSTGGGAVLGNPEGKYTIRRKEKKERRHAYVQVWRNKNLIMWNQHGFFLFIYFLSQ